MGKTSGNLGAAMQKAKHRQYQKHSAKNSNSQLHCKTLENERADRYVEEAKKRAAGLQSNWEPTDLQEYMENAEAAGKEYATERTTKIIMGGTHVFKDNKVKPLAEMDDNVIKWIKLSSKLSIPKRPAWKRTMRAEEVQENEKLAFSNWRREMSAVEMDENVLLTPFERNLEVWRQLWRVVERSDVVLMIVDARHPLAFRSLDLERWVRSQHQIPKRSETDPESTKPRPKKGKNHRKPHPKKGKKRTAEEDEEEDADEYNEEEVADPTIYPHKELILVLNKSDFLSDRQRFAWATYFQREGVRFIFFSAKEESERLVEEEKRRKREEEVLIDNDGLLGEEESEDDEAESAPPPPTSDLLPTPLDDITHVYTRDEFIEFLNGLKPANRTNITIGTIGYPNVGKSSTINALFGKKKVVVSSTPGKTKHFQTLNLNEHVTLCDCPGLVFPSFATNRDLMVLDGILPVDKLRDCFPPVAIVIQRIPKEALKAHYKITLNPEEDVDYSNTPQEFLLNHLARKRGYMTDHNKPHMHKVAREILKDYVDGNLLYCHPPPKDLVVGPDEEVKKGKDVLRYTVELKAGETLDDDDDWVTDEEGEEYDELADEDEEGEEEGEEGEGEEEEDA